MKGAQWCELGKPTDRTSLPSLDGGSSHARCSFVHRPAPGAGRQQGDTLLLGRRPERLSPRFSPGQRFFLQESPVLYVQPAKDPSRALVLEKATLSWRRPCPGVANRALEPERNGYAHEGTPGAPPPPGAIGPEDTGDGLAPALHRISLAVSKVAASCQAGGPAAGGVA